MTNKYTVRIRMNTLKDYMNYQKFIWTHSFHAGIAANGRYLDAHQTERMFIMMPMHEIEMRFSWMPDEKMKEIRRFFKNHDMLAEDTSVAADGFRPAYQA